MNCYELGLILTKSFVSLDMLEKLTSSDKVHHEVDSIALLVNVVHLDNERVVDGQHY